MEAVFVEAGSPEGFVEIEAAFVFDAVFVVAVPVFGGGKRGAGGVEMEGAAESGLGMLEAVVVAIGKEGTKAKGGGLVADVAKDGGRAAREEEEGFVDKSVAAAEGPAGRIGLERLDPFMAAEGEVAGVLDEAEGVGLAAGEDLVLDSGEENAACGGRSEGSDEKGVVAAGGETGGGTHGKAARFIGFEPFEAGGGVEIPALCGSEAHLHRERGELFPLQQVWNGQ